MDKRATIKYSFKASVPVMAGYIVLGIGFGILLQSKGYGWGFALLMSLYITICRLRRMTKMWYCQLMCCLESSQYI